jgi:hypothetical protein
MQNKNNERQEEKVGVLRCFVVEQWQDIVLLDQRSDF